MWPNVCLTLHYTWSHWGQTFVPEFSSTIVQDNMACQLNIGTFLPKGYHHLILQTGTQHRKRLGMTQGVHSWQTGHHRVRSCGFSLLCHNHSNHHHNPSQPGSCSWAASLSYVIALLLNGAFTFFFLAKQLPALFCSQRLQSCTHPSRQHRGSQQQADTLAVLVLTCGCSPGALPVPSSGSQAHSLEHAAFSQGQGAAAHWAGSQICSQELIRNSWRILFWKGCSG